MTCKCGSNSIVSINAKCGDMCFVSIKGEHGERLEREGYVPQMEGIGGGDYIDFSFCTICGLIQNFCSLTEKEARFAIKGDEEENEIMECMKDMERGMYNKGRYLGPYKF